MFIVEIVFEVILLILRAILYAIGEIICYILLGSIGAFVRWLFFQIVGKPRKMKELRTRRRKRIKGIRKKKKKGENQDELRYGNTTGDVFLGVITVFVVIVIIAYFNR